MVIFYYKTRRCEKDIYTLLKYFFPDSALRVISPLSSDSGRGADYSGPVITSYRSYTEVTKATEDVHKLVMAL